MTPCTRFSLRPLYSVSVVPARSSPAAAAVVSGAAVVAAAAVVSGAVLSDPAAVVAAASLVGVVVASPPPSSSLPQDSDRGERERGGDQRPVSGPSLHGASS
ncbi:MAG: hypothetical protein QM784_19705 [Polyangiaceae bacterium]